MTHTHTHGESQLEVEKREGVLERERESSQNGAVVLRSKPYWGSTSLLTRGRWLIVSLSLTLSLARTYAHTSAKPIKLERFDPYSKCVLLCPLNADQNMDAKVSIIFKSLMILFFM